MAALDDLQRGQNLALKQFGAAAIKGNTAT
jgi:hypothetical protein